MKLTPIIATLRARCPVFDNRVAGAAQFKNLPDTGKLRLPAAYVVPGDDNASEQRSQSDYWQTISEGFSVIIFVSNGVDERGQSASFDVVHDIRNMLFRALLGWNPEPTGNPITYDGGTLLDVNRHELIYQFDFRVDTELTENGDEGEGGFISRQRDELNDLGELETLSVEVDFIDPGTGPDGEVEHRLVLDNLSN